MRQNRNDAIMRGLMRVEEGNYSRQQRAGRADAIKQRIVDLEDASNDPRIRLVFYRICWLVVFLLGNYLYFTDGARKGAGDMFLSDPMAALGKYYIGNPLEGLGALLMWAAAYQTGLVVVNPCERVRHTLIAIALIVVSFGVYSQV
jgi:hypothetical protein